MTRESLGIRKIAALIYYVHDLARVRAFMLDRLDFAETWRSSPELEQQGHQKSAVFEAGKIQVVCSTPVGTGGRAARFLSKHPDGFGTLIFEVEDIERTFRLLDERGGTMINDIERFTDDGGTLAMFSMTTPFGDTTFRFIERHGFRTLFPGLEPHAQPRGGHNAFRFKRVDHLTSNFQTMSPALLWMEHVMGMERFWSVQFHTNDVARDADQGSGLKSVVMIEPSSGIKFANNEPLRPFFKDSQINIFAEDFRGDGVQHAALSVGHIIETVRGLRQRGVEFMPTPGTYYEMLPSRLLEEDLQQVLLLLLAVDEDLQVA